MMRTRERCTDEDRIGLLRIQRAMGHVRLLVFDDALARFEREIAKAREAVARIDVVARQWRMAQLSQIR